ncbi:MAG: polysaccharide pyruvyl transferase family protein [Rhodospirillaceae bacterium]|nr:polysaccharide pyruvyl transferase family protein [Rhodospirillaceae bacterium]
MTIGEFEIGHGRPGPAAAEIRVLGAIASPNLGDRVIGDCLAWLMRRHLPAARVEAMDLVGGIGRPTPVTRFLCKIGPFGRRLAEDRIVGRLAETLSDTGLLVIGGGQLLLDTRMRFPTAIARWVKAARRARIPVAFCAIGVSDRLSEPGRAAFSKALSADNVVHVSTRHAGGVDLMRRYFGNDIAARVSVGPDPAFWAAEVYAGSLGVRGSEIGLGPMDPDLLARRVDDAVLVSRPRMTAFWLEMIAACRRRHLPVHLFTNGAPRDAAYCRDIAAACPPPSVAAAVPATATDLVRAISSFRAIVAHRLHANIIAYALGVPAIGLAWDSKVAEFAADVGRSRFALAPQDYAPDRVVALLAELDAAGGGPDILATMKEASLADVGTLLSRAGLLS